MAADVGRERLRAADADRDRVAEILGTAYTEGRLSRDEYDARLADAFAARTYGDLDRLLDDLPVQPVMIPPAMVAPAEPAAVATTDKTNGLAVASVVCGLAQFLIGPLGTIPAIVFGHIARNQIKRTGEEGAGLALIGLILGWGAVALGMVLLAVSMIVAARVSSSMPAPMP